MPRQISPIPWVGGKAASADIIRQHLPLRKHFDVYCEPFCGALNVLLSLPPARLECVNDLNGHLVNFWLVCRDHAAELQARADSLPDARLVYDQYRASLHSGVDLDPMERAVRWFYCQRLGMGGKAFAGWGYRNHFDQERRPSYAVGYHNAISLFKMIARRLRDVQIECLDFEDVIRLYEAPNCLLYCDPPYKDAEGYYDTVFTDDDHRRLAALLNATPAQVALSYYPHPLIDELYPESRWRRVTWKTHKSVEVTTEERQEATEMLLCNYAPARIATVAPSLWSDNENIA